MNVYGLLGVALCAAFITVLVKQLNPPFAIFASATASVVLAYLSLSYFRPVIELFYGMAYDRGLGSYIKIIMKLTAIGAITCIVSEICSDMGEGTIASRVELIGKGASALTVLPVLEKLLHTVADFLV